MSSKLQAQGVGGGGGGGGGGKGSKGGGVPTETFLLRDVAGDGRCFYASVAVQLGVDTDALFWAYVAWLRTEPLSSEMVEQLNAVEEGVRNATGYAARLAQRWARPWSSERWGSGIDLELLSMFVGRATYVYKHVGYLQRRAVIHLISTHNTEMDAPHSEDILLLWNGAHYSALEWS